MKKFHFPAVTPQNSEALRLAVVQGTFWASMAVGGYQTVYLQNNGFPAAQFGLLNAIACAVAIVAMTFLGMVSDRIGGVRKIVMLTLSLGVSLFALIPLIPSGQPYSALLFLIIIPVVNFFRAPMSAFVDNITVRNCAENSLNYGTIRSSGSLWFAVAGILADNLLIPALGVGSTFWAAAIVMIPAIVLVFFCREPQSGGRTKKSRMGTGELFKNRRFVTFLIFGFFFYVGTAFESNFLPYLMTSIEIDSTNIGLVLSVRALMEIPFLYFIVKLRRRFQLRYLIMLAAVFRVWNACCSAFSSPRCRNSSFSPHSSASATGCSSARRPTTFTRWRRSTCAPRRTACSSPSRRLPAFSATCSAASCSTRWAASRFT